MSPIVKSRCLKLEMLSTGCITRCMSALGQQHSFTILALDRQLTAINGRQYGEALSESKASTNACEAVSRHTTVVDDRAHGFESTCRLSLYREAGVFHQHRVAVAGAEVLVADNVAGDDHGVADGGLGGACDEQVVAAFSSTA